MTTVTGKIIPNYIAKAIGILSAKQSSKIKTHITRTRKEWR